MLHKIGKEIELLIGDPKDQLEVNKNYFARQSLENLIISIVEDNKGILNETTVQVTTFDK